MHWGTPPWRVDFRPPATPLPKSVDVAIIGGGFTGLAAAAWLRRVDPGLSVAVFEAGRIGHGASGRTGGMVLGETAAGDKPGLGDVLAGFPKILRALEVECDLALEARGKSDANTVSQIPPSPGRIPAPCEW